MVTRFKANVGHPRLQRRHSDRAISIPSTINEQEGACGMYHT